MLKVNTSILSQIGNISFGTMRSRREFHFFPENFGETNLIAPPNIHSPRRLTYPCTYINVSIYNLCHRSCRLDCNRCCLFPFVKSTPIVFVTIFERFSHLQSLLSFPCRCNIFSPYHPKNPSRCHRWCSWSVYPACFLFFIMLILFRLFFETSDLVSLPQSLRNFQSGQ